MHGRCQRWGVRELKHLPEGAAPATSRMTQSYTAGVPRIVSGPGVADNASGMRDLFDLTDEQRQVRDRKSTRLNSSHRCISYAVFCLKKKKITHKHILEHAI